MKAKTKQETVVSRDVAALRRSMGDTIQRALDNPEVVEVMVNPDGRVWIDRIGKGREDSGERLQIANVESIIRLIANHIGESADKNNPMIAGTLPETGERFQGLLPPITPAPAFTIRKRPEVIFTLDDYVRDKKMTEAQAARLKKAAEDKENILIAGGTGSGKTTLANALLNEQPFKDSRVVLIEDTPELQCAADDCVELFTKRTEPQVSMAQLVATTLRLRPDRIIIGEVRDGSALDMLKAWNTGHPGGIATLHANSAEDALARIEDLIGEVSETIPYRSIGSAINLIAYMNRTQDGLKLDSIVQVKGYVDGSYQLESV